MQGASVNIYVTNKVFAFIGFFYKGVMESL
jgi:hypothetical protein